MEITFYFQRNISNSLGPHGQSSAHGRLTPVELDGKDFCYKLEKYCKAKY